MLTVSFHHSLIKLFSIMNKLVTLALILFAFAPLQAKIHFTDLPDTLQVDGSVSLSVSEASSLKPVDLR